MSLRSRISPYSRLDPDNSVSRPSVDLTHDAGAAYELEDRVPKYSSTLSTSIEAEPLENINTAYDHGKSSLVASGSISSEPDAQNYQPVTEVRNSFSNTLRSWWQEILAISVSIAALISTAGVLLTYQNQPLSSWTFRYLPNSVVSQLMTVSRSALMFSTASCIGQLSWLHIRQKPQALSDLQSFDDASRGPAGAASILVFAKRYRFPVIIASLITIATLLMEPFSQQVLQFPLRGFLVGGNATYPVTQWYAPAPNAVLSGIDYSSINVQLNSSIQAAIVNAIFDSPTANSWNCPSNASCEWKTAATLGVCSSCTNVTAQTEKKCPEDQTHLNLDTGLVCNYTTPSNFFLQTRHLAGPQVQFITRIATTARSIGLPTSNDSGIVGFATLVQGWNVPLDIHECSLSWCAKVFLDATAEGSRFSVQVDDYPLDLTGVWQGSTDVGYSVYVAGPGYPSSLNSTFTIQVWNEQALSNFLVSVLNTGSFTQFDFQDGGESDTFTLGFAMMSSPSVTYMADNIAASLTNTIRNFTTDNILHNLGDSTFQIQYILVRWEWLAFPAAIVLLGILLLVITIIQSYRDKALVWKCSSLALLFHPLQGWETQDMADTSRKAMDKCAKDMRGQLSQSENAGLRIIKA